jgi:hypothetical protein
MPALLKNSTFSMHTQSEMFAHVYNHMGRCNLTIEIGNAENDLPTA